MISRRDLSVPALLDAAAEQDGEAAVDLSQLTTVINVGTPERMRYMQDRLPGAVPRHVRFATEWPMSGTEIQKGRLRQRIADELAAASVTRAPRLSRPAAQAESA